MKGLLGVKDLVALHQGHHYMIQLGKVLGKRLGCPDRTTLWGSSCIKLQILNLLFKYKFQMDKGNADSFQYSLDNNSHWGR
jgi:hypothetical protein